MILLALLPFMAMAAGQARAQDLSERPVDPPPVPVAPPTDPDQIDFSATELSYDSNSDVVTAAGDVRLFREGNRLRADKVVWNRKSGEVRAEGNVAVTDPQGNVAYGDSVELTDTLKDGMVENLLIVLDDGGRLAAARGTRVNGVSTLERAAYTPCAVIDDKGCPKDPVWKITAVRVVHDPVKHRISYKGARLELLGLPVIPLPGLSHPDGGAGGPGLLVPNIRYSRTNGLELALPYYMKLAPNRDVTITPHVFSDVLPAIEGQYRALTSTGAYQVSGWATYGSRLSATNNIDPNSQRDFRGYFDASGRFQLSDYWSARGSLRLTTDRTFLRRYDITREDRLRSTVELERIDDDSYVSIAGWAMQTLRIGDAQGMQPIALPVVDIRKRFDDPLLGGKIELQANTLALTRTDGQDTQRAFTSARWDLRTLTGMGQEVVFTGYARGDVYHTSDILSTVTESYRGDQGWSGRGIAAAAIDVKWPFVGQLFGGTQRLTPRVQFVATPNLANLRIPNEDARAVDLEDSNLFALNRFAGYDRFEDRSRVTYGIEWQLDRPGLSVNTNVGQSYSLTSKPSIFPNGTGLSSRTSDIVGRTTVRYRDLVSLTHRYRLDKDSLRIRRNEIDATVGTDTTYALVGYLRLDRDIGAQQEDLQDREEVRLGGRVQIARYWSVFGSTVIDLTSRGEDPMATGDGYDPVRHRLGVTYEDDCLELGLTWRRDYADTGDARRGNSFLLRLSLKNIGR